MKRVAQVQVYINFQLVFTNIFIFVALLSVLMGSSFASASDKKVYFGEVFQPEPYFEKSGFKLVRGVTNMITFPGEVPKQIFITNRERGSIGVFGYIKGL